MILGKGVSLHQVVSLFVKGEQYYWEDLIIIKKGWTEPGTFYNWGNKAGRKEVGGRNIGRTFCFTLTMFYLICLCT